MHYVLHAMQTTQQQTNNNVVVVNTQPTVASTTVVVTRKDQSSFIFAFIVTFILLFCGCWWSLFCTIPAMVLGNMVRVELTMYMYSCSDVEPKGRIFSPLHSRYYRSLCTFRLCTVHGATMLQQHKTQYI